jgi:hypothetical protein
VLFMLAANADAQTRQSSVERRRVIRVSRSGGSLANSANGPGTGSAGRWKRSLTTAQPLPTGRSASDSVALRRCEVNSANAANQRDSRRGSSLAFVRSAVRLQGKASRQRQRPARAANEMAPTKREYGRGQSENGEQLLRTEFAPRFPTPKALDVPLKARALLSPLVLISPCASLDAAARWAPLCHP